MQNRLIIFHLQKKVFSISPFCIEVTFVLMKIVNLADPWSLSLLFLREWLEMTFQESLSETRFGFAKKPPLVYIEGSRKGFF